MKKHIRIKNIPIGHNHPFVLIAGPCVIEGHAQASRIARRIKDITSELGIPFIFKASYDKANRTSVSSFRGPGLRDGLAILRDIRDKLNLPVLSDVHTPDEVGPAAEILDVLQIPAFLCRQTDLLVEAGRSKKVVNIKKGQFLAPEAMARAAAKVASTGNRRILLTERGSMFGYQDLIADFRSIPRMRSLGYPVVMDATHSVQQPGGLGHASGGRREFVPLMSRCGLAAGCDALFMEVHPDPDTAKSDGPNMWPLRKLKNLLTGLAAFDACVRENGGRSA